MKLAKLVPLDWCIITKMTPNFSNSNKIIAFQLRNVRTNRIDDAHKPRGGQYLLLRTNRKRTVRGAHKTRDCCTGFLRMMAKRQLEVIIKENLCGKVLADLIYGLCLVRLVHFKEDQRTCDKY